MLLSFDMKHTLPDLPFDKNALEPILSRETIEYHWGRHHRGYVEKLNALINETEFESLPLDKLLITTRGPIFNNAAQHWNHSFYWQCLSPEQTQPKDKLLTAIKKSFGSLEILNEHLAKAATEFFGSGWAWLVLKSTGSLAIEATLNADNPLRRGDIPLLTLDLWEHAYYIDYRNERAKYLNHLKSVLNWNLASRIFSTRTPFSIVTAKAA